MKLNKATAVLGKVTVNNKPETDDIPINSKGVGPSGGVALFNGEETVYIANTQDDLEAVIEDVVLFFEDVSDTISTKPVIEGQPVDIAFAGRVAPIIARLEALKGNLK